MPKVEKIEVIAGGDEPLFDLTLSDDPRYYVSSTGQQELLTHNTSWPDIDCLHTLHRVITPDGTKCLQDIKVGDEVIDARGDVRKVLFVQHRLSDPKKDVIYSLLCRQGDTYGCIIANHKHRLLKESGEEIPVLNIHVAQSSLRLLGTEVIKTVLVHRQIPLTDITVERTATFRVVPFDVTQVIDDNSNSKALNFFCAFGYTGEVELIESEKQDVQEG